MFKKKEATPLQISVYEKEIKRLEKDVRKWIDKYELANKYKKEYEDLKISYEKKIKKLDKLIEENKKINEELATVYKNCFDKNIN